MQNPALKPYKKWPPGPDSPAQSPRTWSRPTKTLGTEQHTVHARHSLHMGLPLWREHDSLGMLHPTQGADPGLHGGCGIHLALPWSGCSIPLLPVLQSSSPRKPPGQGQH